MAVGVIMRGRSNSLPVINVSAVSRAIDNRRNGLGNIFQGQKPKDIAQVSRGKLFARSLSTYGTEKVSGVPVGHSIRFNLTSGDFEIHNDVFEQMGSKDESSRNEWCNGVDGDYQVLPERELTLDTSLVLNGTVNHVSFSLDQTVNTRRLALADIFENVEQDCLLELLAIYSTSGVTDLEQLRLNTRRNGLANVYENINEQDLKMFLLEIDSENVNGYCDETTSSSSEESEQEQELNVAYRRCRRNALANIYDGVEAEARVSIAGEKDEIEEEAKSFDYQSRRMALANIKDFVSSSDIGRLLDGVNENSAEEVGRCRVRRSAMADIYSETDGEELQSFLRRFNANVEFNEELSEE